MYYYLVAPTIIVRKGDDAFTYHSEQQLAVGGIVRISVGKKEVTGLIIKKVAKPSFVTKPIINELTDRPVPAPLIELAQWIKTYYATPLPTVLQTMLPAGLHKKRRQQGIGPKHPIRKRTQIVLNDEQRLAVQAIDELSSGTTLLHGVTGSGKTQVYIEAARHTHNQGKSAIILVPEISLTPQLVAEFAHHFEKIIVTHSRMTEADRHHAWLAALASDAAHPVVVIGPRSALFMPLADLGLIVIDECHEPSFKQEQAPRYSALRVASMLVRFHKQAKAVFGSATPAVTDYYLAEQTKSPILTLTQTALAASKPQVHLVDSRSRDNFREHRFVSDRLIAHIREALAGNTQTLLFHNRRGTAPLALCAHCGWTALCPNCGVPLTLHADRHQLVCHLCGQRSSLLPSCPECHRPDIVFKGLGTKQIENEIRRLFPKARVARFDADNSREETLASRYQELYDGTIDIIIGTQLLAKGLDLPHLRTVGVIQADSGLQIPDYQADERVFQLIYQVAGRVGRGSQPSSVIIQTYQPEHPIIRLALARDYRAFYQQELSQRRIGGFPPFTQLLKLTCTYQTEAGAIHAAQRLAKLLREAWPETTVLGPAPAFYERLNGAYRWQLLIKSRRRADLVAIASSTMPPQWHADLDPASLL